MVRALLVRPPEDGDAPSEAKLETVIVPLDQSEIAEEVLPQVAAMSRDAGLNALLVSATPSEGEYHRYMYSRPLDAAATMYTDRYEEFSKAAEAAAMEHLHRAKERIKSMGAVHVEEKLIHGEPADAIVDLAKETPNALVAMTTHGRSGVGRWILGSVTDRVVRYSGDPVLVVCARASEIAWKSRQEGSPPSPRSSAILEGSAKLA